MLNNKVFVSVGNSKNGCTNISCHIKVSEAEAGEAADLFDDVVEEDNLCEFHGEVVLVGARLQVADHRRTYAERRHQEAGEDEICRGPRLRVH